MYDYIFIYYMFLMSDWSLLFKIFSDEYKYKILKLLMNAKSDLCVNEIAEKLNLSQSNTSHKLIKLRDLGFIEGKSHGQIVCYALLSNEKINMMKRLVNIIENEE